MAAFGAKAYQNVAVHTSVASADPHKMTMMLYDGALQAIKVAQAHLGTRQVAAKCEAIGKAVCIVEEGLKASVDRTVGGELPGRLVALYDYIALRLLQANLRNDRMALAEAEHLLNDLRSAWAQIAPKAGFQAAAPTRAGAAEAFLHS